MASITNIRRINMCRRLAAGDCSIMAADTSTDHLRVIHRTHRNGYPGVRRRQMTSVADIRGVDMACTLARSNNPIVTTGAAANHLAMIHRRRNNRSPRGWPRLVAGITGIGRVNMVSVLSAGDCSVMTTDASPQHLGMINGRWRNRNPRYREFFMAGFAGVGGIDMGWAFTTGGYTIVTTDTVINKWCVINTGR